MRAILFDENGLKECNKCRIKKTREEFYPRPDYKCGVRPTCKECEKRIQKEYNKIKPKDPKKNREDKYKRTYGIKVEEYDKMFIEQGGVCKICKKPQTVQNRKNGRVVSHLHVDHCHKTGKVRGLLCHNCNFALGYFKDSKLNLISALKYLEETEKNKFFLSNLA